MFMQVGVYLLTTNTLCVLLVLPTRKKERDYALLPSKRSIYKTFHYSIGTHLTSPLLFYYGNRIGDGTTDSNRDPCLVQVSESKTPLSTFNNGNTVGYDWVEEDFVGNDNPSQITHYYKNEAETDVFDDNFVESPVIINYTNGLQTKIEFREDDELIKTELYDYSDTYSDFVYAFIDRNGHFGSDDVLNYYYRVRWPQKCHKEEILFVKIMKYHPKSIILIMPKDYCHRFQKRLIMTYTKPL